SPDKDGRLLVAAAVRTNDVMCTSLPERERMLIDFLATRSFRVIAPMDVSRFKGSIVMAAIKDLRLFDSKKKDEGKVLQGVYDTRCGQHVGTLIRHTGEEGLQV